MAPLVDVYLPVPSWTPYTYAAREHVPANPRGCRVVVPVRRGWKVGICAGLHEGVVPSEVKLLREFLDEEPVIPPDLWGLGMWMADYYMCPPGITLLSMLPGPCRPGVAPTLHAVPGLETLRESEVPAELWPLVARLLKGPASRDELREMLGEAGLRKVGWLVDRGMASWNVAVRGEPTPRTVLVASLPEPPGPAPRTEAGRRLLRALEESGGVLPVRDLLLKAGSSRSALQTLVRGGSVVLSETSVTAATLRERPREAFVLSPSQRAAIEAVAEAVRSRTFASFLLHGVTGSGKTEVYMGAAAVAIEAGRSVLCLVPEIALTAQMLATLTARFGARVVVLHSGLSPGERHEAWERAAMRGAIVVGPRSAVFAPLRDLGLVIVDEEHDASYKQGRDPRYHGRDVAIMRAYRSACPVVLGSATPSLETYQAALTGKHVLLRLPERVDGWPMPRVSVVDMRVEPRGRGPLIFSSLLRTRIEEALGRDEQALLLLNRRGFARSVQCADCGYLPRCPACDICLTFHRRDRRYLCHYCGYAEPAGDACPSCRGQRLGFGGVGTERVEEELLALFPQVRSLRMDRDTIRGRDAHVRIIDAMERKEASVLVGTQMIAKGLDLPNVTVVGVINADTSLQFPDFRAGERAFQLLTQVAGRAGRRPGGGHVVLQSYLVDYPALLAAAGGDYESFAHEELAQRREAGYPPFSALIRLEVRGTSQETVERCAGVLAGALAASKREGGRFLGPSSPLLPRQGGFHRRHLLVFHPRRSLVHAWVKDALARAGDLPSGTRLVVDVDPVETV